MARQGTATDRRSLVEDIEFGPSDHSSALQLLSLGKPRTSAQQPQPQLNQQDGEPQAKLINIPTTTLSPHTTHGRHRKKRRMLEAQQAAMASLSGTMDTSEEDNRNKNSSLHTEAANILSGFNAASDTTQNSTPDRSYSSSLSKPPTKVIATEVNGCKGSNTVEENSFVNHEQGGSPQESEKSMSRLPLKKMGKKRTGSRRHATLPLNRQKNGEDQEDIVLQSSEPTRKVKKPRNKKSSKSIKSSSDFAEESTIEYVDNPTDKDILLGQRKFNSHPGNEVYRNTVRTFQPQIKTKERTEVAREIIDHIHDVIGGRFLKFDSNNRWHVIRYEDVMTKVGKAIVELRNKSSPAAKKVPNRGEIKSVLESFRDVEKQGPTSRPKRKATLGRKLNQYDERDEPSEHKKKKPKLPGSKIKISQENTSPTSTIVEVERTFEEYIYKSDPNEYYVEEIAHVYHNPPFPSKWTNGVTIEDLRPIPPPPPLPNFPNTGSCQWSFDESNRVIIADFSVGKNGDESVVTLEDSKFLFEMHERTDITVISRGLLNMSKIDSSMWSLGYFKKCVGREFYHKFRRFDKIVDEKGIEAYREKDNLFSMRFEDYVEYCEKRESYMNEMDGSTSYSSAVEEPIFDFEDHLGKTHSVGIGTSALYMIDVDIKRLTPLLYRNFLDSFELPAVLPGGSHCMMNSVTPDARPFMGPNLYVTPPASFTHFHQDGHGTVDSGHLCISGYNEVVMLRRLTERHKKHALWILSGKKPGGSHFDGLYSMPHGDGLGEKPSWPDRDMIDECKKMGYCPSMFTLEPGDLVHINKGRLHAFRKMSTSKLRESDCHADQRRQLIESKGIAGKEKLCVSVAWDWMYRGVTSAGINKEVCTVLEGSTLNRRNDVTSLAIPELALLQMAKSIPSRSLPSPGGGSFLDALKKNEKKRKNKSFYESTKEEICKGIYPGLCIVVGQHIRALNVNESKSTEKGARLSIAKIPDTQENPATCPLDPYGDSDFECKLCRKELSNVYFHCDGCEKLLSKDFNICRGCYLQGKFNIKVQMHPSNPKRHATLNHMGDNKFNRQSRCPCKNGPACNYCGFCLGCSCRCHTWFTMRTRLCNAADEAKLLETVKDTAIKDIELEVSENEANETNGTYKIEESTNYLRDRLKNAGDEELLNEDKKDDTEVKEDVEKPLNDNENGDTATNGYVDSEMNKEIKNEVKENKDDVENIQIEDNNVQANADDGDDEMGSKDMKNNGSQPNIDDDENILNHNKIVKVKLEVSDDKKEFNMKNNNRIQSSDDDVDKFEKGDKVIPNDDGDKNLQNDLSSDNVKENGDDRGKFRSIQKKEICNGHGIINEAVKQSLETEEDVLI